MPEDAKTESKSCPYCGHSENGAWVLPCPNKECPRHKMLGEAMSNKVESTIDQMLLEFPEVEHFILLVDFRDGYSGYSNCYVRHTVRPTPQRAVQEQIFRLMRLCLNAGVTVAMRGMEAIVMGLSKTKQPAPEAPTEGKE
jgi:hypothetical protein